MSEKRNQLTNEIKRRRVVQLLKAGYSASAATKETGYTYAYVKMVYEQEVSDDGK